MCTRRCIAPAVVFVLDPLGDLLTLLIGDDVNPAKTTRRRHQSDARDILLREHK